MNSALVKIFSNYCPGISIELNLDLYGNLLQKLTSYLGSIRISPKRFIHCSTSVTHQYNTFKEEKNPQFIKKLMIYYSLGYKDK